MVVVGVQFIRRRQVGAPFDRRDRRLTIEGRRFSGFEADDGDVVSDGEDEAGEVYFTRRSIVPRVADERHWTTPSRRAPNALQIARASLQCPGTPRPGSTPPAAALPSMVLPPPATQSTSGQQ